jgi:hypothetical protein
MLSIDFDNLAQKYPDLEDAWRGLKAWLKSHPRDSYIDTRLLAREIRMDHPDPETLTIALNRLKEQAGLRQVYWVFDPKQNQFLRGEWNRFNEVPEQVRDNFDNYIAIENLRIVPVLKQVKGA